MIMEARFWSICLMVATAVAVVGAQARENDSTVPVSARDTQLEASADEYDYDQESQVLDAKGNVRIGYGDLELRSESVHFEGETGKLQAGGGVQVRSEDGTFAWQGDEVRGNLEKKHFEFGASSGRLRNWFYRVGHAERTEEGIFKLDDVVFSTCEHVEETGRPGHYSVHAKRARSWPDGRYKAWSPTFRIGSVPIFWLPYVAGDTTRAQGWHVRGGYAEDPGAFLFVEREFSLGEHWRSQAMTHVRSNNGLALGVDVFRDTDVANTRLLLYGMNDNDEPGSDSGPHAGFNQGFEREDDRYRLRLEHRSELDEHWQLWAQVEWLSDVDMLEDFFEDEYRRSPNPSTFVELQRNGPDWTLALRSEARINDFDTVVQRLPELTAGIPRRPLGLGFEYEGAASVGLYERKWRDYDEALGHALPEDYDSARADTLHMLYRPFRLGAVNVVPRMGGRITWYGDSSAAPAGSDDNLQQMFEADDPLDPYNGPATLQPFDDDGGSRTRFAGELGAEISTTFFRTSPNVHNRLLGLDGMRHVVQPYANYTYAPEPSEEREFLYFFDELDRLTEQHFVRLGLRQSVQTRRDERVHEIARLDTYTDLHVEEEGDHGRTGNAGVDAQFRPSEAFVIDFNGIVDLDDGDTRLARMNGAIGAEDTLRVELGYSYRNDTNARTYYSMGSSLPSALSREWLFNRYGRSETLTAQASYPFNPRTRLTVGLEYDAEDSQSAETFARLTRQFHCLMGSLSLSRDSDEEVSLMLYFWIKDYPRFGVSTSSG